jgi:hypothetical protein
MEFKEFLTEIELGNDMVNESTDFNNYAIRQLISNATNQLDCIKPTLQTVYNSLNCCGQPVLATTSPKTAEQQEKEVENLADDKVLLEKYEKIVAAHAKAAVEYLKTLNKELKSVK